MSKRTRNSVMMVLGGATIGSLAIGTAVEGAPIVANFTGGNGATSVDQYLGIAGGGWATAWSRTGTAKSGFPTVGSATPLNGGGNYLKVQSDITNEYVTVSRQWDNAVASYASPTTVKFDLRWDSIANPLNSTGDVLDVFEGSTFAAGSFHIYAFGATNGSVPASTWAFYNGAKNNAAFDPTKLVSTGVAMNFTTVYSFTINLDPAARTWTGTVTNGINTYTSPTAIGFNSASTSLGGVLNFETKGSFSSDDPTFSTDNISIIVPEPGSLAVLGMAGMAMLRRRRH